MVDAESVVEEEGCWRCLRKHVELEMKLAVLPLLSVAAARLSASAVVEVDREGSTCAVVEVLELLLSEEDEEEEIMPLGPCALGIRVLLAAAAS